MCLFGWSLLGTLGGVRAQAALLLPAPESEYDVALEKALEAHARGDHETARSHMERAHQLEPSARTLRGLGIVALAQERMREAAEYLEAALVSDLKPLSGELRASVEELLKGAYEKLTRIELIVERGSRVRVDDAAPVYSAPDTLLLPPGSHRFEITDARGAVYTFSDVAKPGEKRTLRVVSAPCQMPSEGPAERPPALLAKPPTAAPASLRPAFWTRNVRNGALLGGGLLIAASVTTYSLAYVRLEKLSDSCREHGCTEAEAEGRFRNRNIEGLAITSGVLAGTGGAVLIATGLIELWRYRQKSQPKLGVALGLTSIGVTGAF